MTQPPEERPRPTPRPRPGAAARPSPRPRVAGSRRDRDDADEAARTPRPAPVPSPRPARGARPAGGDTARGTAGSATTGSSASGSSSKAGRTATATAPARPARPARAARPAAVPARQRRGVPGLALALAVLCVLTAAAGGFLLWQRLRPPYVDSAVFAATRSNVQALYAFDYKSADRSVAGKLAVLSGPLRDQYRKDLSQGGIIDTYKQVSATTSYDVLDVGLQQINGAQDAATLVVFGQYVVKSVNSGTQPAPQGSECQVTPDGAQSCTQTVQVQTSKVGGKWRITQLTLLTTT